MFICTPSIYITVFCKCKWVRTTSSYWYYIWKNWFIFIFIDVICLTSVILVHATKLTMFVTTPRHNFHWFSNHQNMCITCWDVTNTKHCGISAKLNCNRRCFTLICSVTKLILSIFAPCVNFTRNLKCNREVFARINFWCGNSSVYIYINYTCPYSLTVCIYGTNCCRTVLSWRNKFCSVNSYYIFIIRNKCNFTCCIMFSLNFNIFCQAESRVNYSCCSCWIDYIFFFLRNSNLWWSKEEFTSSVIVLFYITLFCYNLTYFKFIVFCWFFTCIYRVIKWWETWVTDFTVIADTPCCDITAIAHSNTEVFTGSNQVDVTKRWQACYCFSFSGYNSISSVIYCICTAIIYNFTPYGYITVIVDT